MLARRLLFLVAGLIGVSTAFATDPPSSEARLREQLRGMALQLRTAENDRATLQADKARADEELRKLTEQNATLSKRLAADKESADKAAADAKEAAERAANESAALRAELGRTQLALKQSTDLAAATEAKRAKATSEAVVLQRRVSDQQTRNAAMYRLGVEILNRYERFGLGDALTAREPFIGITRTKFQNLIQDYGDKLADQRIKP